MEVLIVANAARSQEVRAGVEAAGHVARLRSPLATAPAKGGLAAVASLATAFTELEAELLGHSPGAVVLADDSDAALAAAIGAAKAEIPCARAGELDELSPNGRLIAQLATELGGEGESLAAWLDEAA